jgi:histidyl-tRNA synthetase
MPETFKAPSGTHDILPPESLRWEALVARFATHLARSGYGLHIPPMFEDAAVFARVGESTDVVRKEMYEFEDRGGRLLALRPEGTASVARAYVQHRPTTPWKVWYVAPNFRYERSQAGRYKQHHQVGAEVVGSEDPDVDVEVIALLWEVLRSLGLTRLILLLNSLGDEVCRPDYLAGLSRFLEEHQSELCDEHRERWAVNPLRVLDCKRKACREATRDAPRLVDHLCDPCRAHFERVQTGLGRLGVPFALETRLVRGLDYYTRTTFEIQAGALDSAQNALGGGGRYDGLVELLGGPPTPGIGFGAGIERILLACDAEGVGPTPDRALDVFVVDVAGGETALVLTDELRRAGLSADRAFDGRSMKSQLKAADRSGARVALIVGEQELADGTVALRELRDGHGEQEVVPRDAVVERVRSAVR